MKKKVFIFWEKGYIYCFLGILPYILLLITKNIGTHDWKKEIAYFIYIKESFINYNTLPWFWWNKPAEIMNSPAITQTSSFISNPETMIFSPLIPLIFFFNPIFFVKILFIIHSLIGILGVFLLKKRFNWNYKQFRIFLILFMISPVIIQHLSIGYTPWINLFFFPWLVYFISDNRFIIKIFCTSCILAICVLQGGAHTFFWFSIFILLYFVNKSIISKKIDITFSIP